MPESPPHLPPGAPFPSILGSLYHPAIVLPNNTHPSIRNLLYSHTPYPTSRLPKLPPLVVTSNSSCSDYLHRRIETPSRRFSASHAEWTKPFKKILTIPSCPCRMEEQLKVLNMYFKHSAIQFPEDPNEKDENLIEGEY